MSFPLMPLANMPLANVFLPNFNLKCYSEKGILLNATELFNVIFPKCFS
jgi:hypothetical protein